jgi:cellulose synthase/poly-beta-1,6-N-acetylglucosamine synthase-like glycosyltransferase
MIVNIAIVLIVFGIFLFISKEFFKRFNNNYPESLEKKTSNFAIIIPARDESNVIEDLIISIENQSIKINSKNIYIIVEDKNDPTIEIAKKHQINIILRKKIELKRKGYALMEGIESIIKEKKYDAYFIFDADNILDPNYFKEMTKTYEKGYDIGIGYRKIKNKENAIAVSSGLIFTIINVLSNKNRAKFSLTCNISGTGFYISGKVINNLKTYPFHSLTEDYELSLYSAIHNLTTSYNEKAYFYDEQPTNYNQYFTQRCRWIKGYFEAREIYRKQLFQKLNIKNPNFASIYSYLIGVYDILIIIIALLLLIINFILNSKNFFASILILFLIIYFILAILTAYLIHLETYLNINNKLKIKTILLNPFMLMTYILCAIKVIFVKNLKWEKIVHYSSKPEE